MSNFNLPEEPFLYPSYFQVASELRRHTSPQASEAIADFLANYFLSKPTRITGLRTGLIPTKGLANIGDDNQTEYLIVEWREGDDTDAVAIFKSRAPEYLCNAIFHYAICPWQPREDHWQRSSYTWFVSDLAHLQDLLVVAQHVLRLFPSDETHGPNLMQRFFQDDNNPGCSPEE
jgi:hypothetical protein